MQLNVISSIAVKGAYLDLVPLFEKRSGHQVATQWVGMTDIRKRMEAGETADVVIGSAALVEELARSGRVDTKIDLAKSGVGAAVRAGAPKPEIGSVEALKGALRAAKSIVYSSGPSQQLSELRQVAGIDCVGPLPAEVQLITVFTGAVHARAAQPEAAKALLAFLASPEAAPVMRKHGLEPA